MDIYIVISILVGLWIIQKIYFERKWTHVYTAYGHKKYFEIVYKLKANGITHKTKTPIGAQRRPSEYPWKDFTQYDIYVKKGEEYQFHSMFK